MTPPRVRLNDSALDAARALVTAGAVDREGWAYLEDVDLAPFLEGEPPSWEKVAAAHLGLVVGQDRATAEAYAYPIATTPGTLSRCLLQQCRVKAVHLAHPPIFDAATELLKAMDGETARVTIETYAMAGGVSLGPSTDLGAGFMIPTPPVQVVQVLPWGKAKTYDGRPVLVNEESVTRITADLTNRKEDVVIDFDHGTWDPGGDGAAAGWMTIFEWRLPDVGQPTKPEHGLWATTTWTYRGRAGLDNKDFRYLSPAILQDMDRDGLVLRLLNAGLVNQPNIAGMLPATAAETTSGASLHAAVATAVVMPAFPPVIAAGGPATNPEPSTTVQEEDDSMKIEELLAALGFRSPEEAVSSVKDLQARVSDLGTKLATAVAEVATLSEKLHEQAIAQRVAQAKAANLQGEALTFAETLAKGDNEALFTSFLALHTTRPTSGRLPIAAPTKPAGGKPSTHAEDPVAPLTASAEPDRQALHQEVLDYAAAHQAMTYGQAYEAVSAAHLAEGGAR